MKKKKARSIHFEPFVIFIKFIAWFFVIRAGFEPTTHSLEGCCSIQLSYRTKTSGKSNNY